MLNSFKIHDENATPLNKQGVLQKPLSTNPASSSSIIGKNQKIALAPRKALGDISVNKLNARADPPSTEFDGLIKSRVGDSRSTSKPLSSFKLEEVKSDLRSRSEPFNKVNNAALLSDDSDDIDISAEMKCTRRPLKTFEQICEEEALENVRKNIPLVDPPGMTWPEQDRFRDFDTLYQDIASFDPAVLWAAESIAPFTDLPLTTDTEPLQIPPLPSFEE